MGLTAAKYQKISPSIVSYLNCLLCSFPVSTISLRPLSFKFTQLYLLWKKPKSNNSIKLFQPILLSCMSKKQPAHLTMKLTAIVTLRAGVTVHNHQCWVLESLRDVDNKLYWAHTCFLSDHSPTCCHYNPGPDVHQISSICSRPSANISPRKGHSIDSV